MAENPAVAPLQPAHDRAGDMRVYAGTAIVSLLLSLWASVAQYVPNPDAALYLRAAEQMVAGEWRQSIATFGWPFYSLLIAAAMAVTGVGAIVAAQIVNALLCMIGPLCFVAIVGRLAGHQRSLLIIAALVALFHPRLMELRPMIVRDNGFCAFLLLALYLVVRDEDEPSWSNKAGMALAVGAAGLFRLEALVFAATIPGYLAYVRMRSRRGRVAVMLVVAALMMLMLPGYLAWSGRIVQQILSFDFNIDLSKVLDGHLVALHERIRLLETTTLAPNGSHFRWGAFFGIVIAIGVIGVFRAITWPAAVLSGGALVFGIVPQRARRFVLWFSGWQLPLILLYIFFAMTIEWRYAFAFALTAIIPVVFAADAAVRGLRSGKPAHQVIAGVVVLGLLATAAWYLPRRTQLGYLQTAGEWIRLHTDRDSRVVTNHRIIAYYSGRRYDREIHISELPLAPSLMAWADVVLVDVRDGEPPTNLGEGPAPFALEVVSEEAGQRVIAYRLKSKR